MNDHPLFLTVVAIAGMLLPGVAWIVGEVLTHLARVLTHLARDRGGEE